MILCAQETFMNARFLSLLGIILGALGLFFVMAVSSAAQVIFISAVYHNMNGDPVKNFNEQFAESLFRTK